MARDADGEEFCRGAGTEIRVMGALMLQATICGNSYVNVDSRVEIEYKEVIN